jgi:predicted acetyltransferase
LTKNKDLWPPSNLHWSSDQLLEQNSEYLELLNSFEKGEKLAQGYVADTSLFGFLDSEIVGRLVIRHELNVTFDRESQS